MRHQEDGGYTCSSFPGQTFVATVRRYTTSSDAAYALLHACMGNAKGRLIAGTVTTSPHSQAQYC